MIYSNKSNGYRFLFKLILIFIFFGLVGYYARFQSKNLREGPQIKIDSPENGSVFNDSLLEIRGQAKNITNITLNDKPIFISETGLFREKLLLSYGYNIIELHAEDRFGRETNEVLELIYK